MTRQWKNDEGASLILVIIFVMVFAVVIGAVLDFASTGFKTTEEVVSIRNQQHAVDGAMDGAINSFRRTGFGTDANPCPDWTYNSTTDGDPTVTVKCTADLLTGEGKPSDKVPEYAILTGLWRNPTDTCAGYVQTGNNEMLVRGGMFSNGRIAVNQFENGSGCGSLSGTGHIGVIWGNAFARGKCTWWATNAKPEPKLRAFVGARACNGGNLPPDDDRPLVDEAVPEYAPNYSTADEVANAAAVTDIFTAGAGSKAGAGYDPLPDCTSADTVTFHPGVYTEIPTHHYERADCTGDIWYFEPGTYYFDFPEDDNLWNVNPYNIIGGTLTQPLATIAAQWNTAADHHVCDEDPFTENAGVQFIFGGASRIATQGNAAETQGIIDLCAGKSPTLSGDADTSMNQRIVVYALQPGQDETPATGTNQVRESDGAIEGDFSNLVGAQSDDSDSATKNLTPSNETGFVNFKSFADIPEGATVTSVVAEIHHSETGTTSGLKRSLKFNYESDPAGTTFEIKGPQCTSTGGVDTCNLDFLEDPLLWREINSLRDVTYSVEVNLNQVNVCTGQGKDRVCVPEDETANVSLDTVIIKVSYVEAGFEPQEATAQPFLTTTSNPVALFEGTFFAPYADLALNVHNAGTTEFSRGVIANHIKGEASESSKQTTAPFRLPDSESLPVVLLEAFVDGKSRLRVRAAFEDGDGLFGRRVHIRDWVYVRDS